ncbi:MAG: hypothetical protein HY743_09005 [Deltaproteobacteria bacterium]|nr:hypothetical protein [Deltaproteobacteria bacterium]
MGNQEEIKQSQDLSPERQRELRALARRLGHRFKDLRLLDQALASL